MSEDVFLDIRGRTWAMFCQLLSHLSDILSDALALGPYSARQRRTWAIFRHLKILVTQYRTSETIIGGKWQDIPQVLFTWGISCHVCAHLSNIMPRDSLPGRICPKCGAAWRNMAQVWRCLAEYRSSAARSDRISLKCDSSWRNTAQVRRRVAGLCPSARPPCWMGARPWVTQSGRVQTVIAPFARVLKSRRRLQNSRHSVKPSTKVRVGQATWLPVPKEVHYNWCSSRFG